MDFKEGLVYEIEKSGKSINWIYVGLRYCEYDKEWILRFQAQHGDGVLSIPTNHLHNKDSQYKVIQCLT